MKTNEIPSFGTMRGVRVLSVGTNIAGPVAATLFAEQGADVIQVESALSPDMFRTMGKAWAIEHRNTRAMALNTRTPKGEEVLKRLLKTSDVLIESSKGGTWNKWGLTDEVLWELNPKLVIVHVSGYGQTGDPEYVSRGSFDTIGQAFGGFMAVNGMPEPLPPLPVKPYTCDYVTALFAAFSAAMALYRARETGEGESIDLAQYETMARIQGNFLVDALNGGKQPERTGEYGNTLTIMPNVMRCGDGNYVSLGIGGAAVCKRLEDLLGLTGDPDFESPHAGFKKADGPRAQKAYDAMVKFCSERSAEEVNNELNAIKVPCSVIMTFEMMRTNAQYQARKTLIEWDDPIQGEGFMGVAPIPTFKRNPGQVFRGGPTYGMDNEDILAELGYGESEIAALYEEGTIKNDKEGK